MVYVEALESVNKDASAGGVSHIIDIKEGDIGMATCTDLESAKNSFKILDDMQLYMTRSFPKIGVVKLYYRNDKGVKLVEVRRFSQRQGSRLRSNRQWR